MRPASSAPPHRGRLRFDATLRRAPNQEKAAKPTMEDLDADLMAFQATRKGGDEETAAAPEAAAE